MLNHQTKGSSNKKIIFVHGNSQSLHYWDDVIGNQTLSENYSLIAMDLPGHGQSFRSKEPQKDYSLIGMAKHVKDFVSKFENEEYILAGNSLGTNLIGEIAKELVNCKGIMLIGSTAFGKNLTAADIFKPNPNGAACFMAEPNKEQINLLFEDAAYKLPEEKNKEVKTIFTDTDGNFRSQMAEAVTKGEFSDELMNIELSKIPAAVIFGEEDKICFIDYLDKVPFPKWKNKTVLIANSGHCSQLDQPIKLAEIINEFAHSCFK